MHEELVDALKKLYAERIPDPRRKNYRVLFAIECARQIDDCRTRVRGCFPVFAGQFGAAGEEGEVGMDKGCGRDLLDKGDFITDRFQLPNRLLIVHQNKIGRRKR